MKTKHYLRYLAVTMICSMSFTVNAQVRPILKGTKNTAVPYVIKNAGKIVNPQLSTTSRPVLPVHTPVGQLSQNIKNFNPAKYKVPRVMLSSEIGKGDFSSFKRLLLEGDTIGAIALMKESKSGLPQGYNILSYAMSHHEKNILFFLSNCYEKGLYGVAIDHHTASMCLFFAAMWGQFNAQIEYGKNLWNTKQPGAVKYLCMADNQAEKDTTLLNKNWNEIANIKYLLGYCFYNGVDTICNVETSIGYLEKGAKMGDVRSALMLGDIYSSGDKVQKNDSLAAVYMNYAAQKGNKIANVFMGNAYYYGVGVQRDSLMAIPYYRVAALKGDGDSQSRLAVFNYNAQNYNEAILWGSKPECEDSVETQFIVGCSYFYNNADFENAVRWWKKAAAKEHPQALWELAMINKNGLNNDSIAFNYFFKCANMGNTEAMNEVGCAYLSGSGIEQNIEKGMEWLKQGAYTGNANAAENLASIYQVGRYGIKRNKELCLTYWKLGAENGSDECQYNYGMCLKKGKGVPKDKDAAIRWISEAATKGHLNATKEMEKMKIW